MKSPERKRLTFGLFDLFGMNFSALQLHQQSRDSSQMKSNQNQSRSTKYERHFLTG
jgi:hypothetical protein